MSDDIGMQRARIAPLLTGEDMAELLALADFTIAAGGSLRFGSKAVDPLTQRLIGMGLVERARVELRGSTATRRASKHRLTKLGWLTLLTRAENEMAHLLPKEDEEAA